MFKSILINALGVALTLLVMTAGLLVPAKLLGEKEREYLNGEWSEVSIGDVGVQWPSSTPSPETLQEKRLANALACAAEHPLKDFANVGMRYYENAKLFSDDQLLRLAESGALPAQIAWLIPSVSDVAKIAVYGDAEQSFLAEGRRAGSAYGANEVGLVHIRLWIASFTLRGSVEILADAQTGRVIDLDITLSGLGESPEFDAYSVLWAYAVYLGLSAQDGFNGSIGEGFIMMDFGRSAVKLESSSNMTVFRFRLCAVPGSLREKENE